MKTALLATFSALFALTAVLCFMLWQYQTENRLLREQLNRIETYARRAEENSDAARRSAESAEVSAMDALEQAKETKATKPIRALYPPFTLPSSRP